MKRMSRISGEAASVEPGFQLAPMVDVVFVIMLFFMVMAGMMKAERALSLELPNPLPENVKPGVCGVPEIITIDSDGVIALNDEQLDPLAPGRQPRLTATLARLKAEADHRRAKVLVEINAAPDAEYTRVIDAMNSLSTVGIRHVTFIIGGWD